MARRRLVASGKEEAQATVDRHEKVNLEAGPVSSQPGLPASKIM